MEKANKNLNRIKVILAEKNLQNKWLAETKLRFPNGQPIQPSQALIC